MLSYGYWSEMSYYPNESAQVINTKLRTLKLVLLNKHEQLGVTRKDNPTLLALNEALNRIEGELEWGERRIIMPANNIHLKWLK